MDVVKIYEYLTLKQLQELKQKIPKLFWAYVQHECNCISQFGREFMVPISPYADCVAQNQTKVADLSNIDRKMILQILFCIK